VRKSSTLVTDCMAVCTHSIYKHMQVEMVAATQHMQVKVVAAAQSIPRSSRDCSLMTDTSLAGLESSSSAVSRKDSSMSPLSSRK